MPELPEVEVSRLGIVPFLVGETVSRVVVRESRLRWPVPSEVQQLEGQKVVEVLRRGKYLLLQTALGCAILHLGMSGSLRVLPQGIPFGKHDHLDIELSGGKLLRLNDPRRFGAFLWTSEPWAEHPLLKELGPEPLSDAFTAGYLADKAKGRTVALKNFIMNSHLVVGVGNIYANEALFRARLHPAMAAGRVTFAQYELLTNEIKAVLAEAIAQGGTTLRDFTRSDGRPGYFAQELKIYGRNQQHCPVCGAKIERSMLGNRATYFCPHCQPLAD